jgi:enoyl-CoA hydratase/carnithine racemase
VSAAEELVLLAIEEPGIAIVTINRPEKRNAISLAVWPRLGEIFHDLAERPEVRVVILTGAGGHFSAGADISEFATTRNDSTQAASYGVSAGDTSHLIRDYPKPVIAAVHGYGVGGGCGLALNCDFRIGDQTTRMGIPAARLGIVYGAEACRSLVQQVGPSNAKRILFSGKIFGADEALRFGLLDQIAEGSALDGARALALEFVENAPLSIRGAKYIVNAVTRGEDEGIGDEIQAFVDRAFNSEDYREGQRAFKEKRRPQFQGR